MDVDTFGSGQFTDLLTLLPGTETGYTPGGGRRRGSSSASSSASGGSSTSSISADGSSSASPPTPPTKTKRRYTEKRRQQALIASRNRRGAEAGLFQDLGQSLPVSAEVLKSMDKLAVLRVAVSYSKLRGVIEHLQIESDTSSPPAASPNRMGNFTPSELDSLLRDGFLIIMSTHGEIIYVSDSVSRCLRCDKHAVLGTNIYDHIQPTDRHELDRLLSVESVSQIVPAGRTSGRGACAFKTPRDSAIVQLRGGGGASGGQGAAVPATGAGAVKVTGKVFLNPTGNFFIGVVEPLTQLNPFDFDFPFPLFTVNAVLDWVCTADMKCVSYDMKMGHCAAYDSHELKGVSVFELMHAEDMAYVREGLKWMYKYGEVQSPQGYRMLIKNGGWAWFVTQASTMQVQMRGEDGSLKATTFCGGRHFMISEVFEPGEVLAPIQRSGGGWPMAGAVVAEIGGGDDEMMVEELPNPISVDPLLDEPPTSAMDMDLDLSLGLGLGLGLLSEDDWLQELGTWAEDGVWGLEPVSGLNHSNGSQNTTTPSRPSELSVISPVTPIMSPPPSQSPPAQTLMGGGIGTRFPQLTSLLMHSH